MLCVVGWGKLRGEDMDEKAMCARCGKPYVRKRRWQKFCSSECRWQDYDERNPRQKKPPRDDIRQT